MALVKDLLLIDFGDPYPGEPAFHRPSLVVGPPDYFGASFPFTLVIPLTTTDRKLSLHIEVEANASNGLSSVSYVQCEQIRSVNKDRVIKKLGILDTQAMAHVDLVIKMLLDH